MFISALQNDLCIRFVNTRYWRGTDAPTESLQTIGELFDWVGKTCGLDARELAGLNDWAAARPDAARALLAAAIDLREAIHRASSALANGASVAEADLRLINEALAQGPPRHRVLRQADRYGWEVAPVEPRAPVLLAPVLWSAADLITQAPVPRLRQCANPKCRWLFNDASKSGTRRWCDMSSCGNRAKAHRHYQKTRGA